MVTLNEHFEKSGAWLFRRRSYLPIFLFAIVLLGMRDFHYPAERYGPQTTLWELGCFGVGLLGLLVRSITVGYAALGTSGRVSAQEADALNTSGMYSIVRHPLYLGNYLMWMSVALLTYTVWVPLVIALVFWLYYERIMIAEEGYLRVQFGDQFERWAATTRAFIPNPSTWQSPNRPFALRRVLRRERSGLLGLTLSFAAFELIVGSLARGAIHVDPVWTLLAAFSFLIYAALEIEKRRARRHAVQG